ncbi:hypothetical protein [Deinococcus sp. DB0503]|uniref:hypothetical protein n=1 Tax=Deinococcus sp. DB0503 TaxID=2479203 RepID=UPI0018E0608D|nr:hypothetical protein [Deinococcus sp. DB0503]MBI0446911.1 hypothetical protein [Deinococcus sp. DB0503]
MQKVLLVLSLLSAPSLSLAAPSAATLGGNMTTRFNALDLQDHPMVLKMHQGETWQLELPDSVAKITAGRDDQVDVQVDSNVVFLKAVQNSGWGNLTIRLKNGDSIQVVYSLASTNGRYIRRVVVEYPADPDLTAPPVQAARPTSSPPAGTMRAAAVPTVRRIPATPAVTGPQAAPATRQSPAATVAVRPQAAPATPPTSTAAAGPQTAPEWLRFGFTGGTRNGTSLTLGYRITNIGTEAVVFSPLTVRMQAGRQPLKVAVLGDQNGTVRVNAGQTVYGNLMIDQAGSITDVPFTWSWIGSTLNSGRQYDVGGPLRLVLAGAGNARR